MFTKFRHIALLSTAAFALQGCASYTSGDTVATVAPAAQQVDLAAIMAKPEGASGPALWKVADEDTTIYLFGTVHLLPETKEWYNGPIATALGGATEIVTEIPIGAMSDPATQQAMMMKALLPPDQNLRDMLSDEDRTAYEAAMGKLDLPPAAFDRFKPWLAGMTLGVLPLMKAGIQQKVANKSLTAMPQKAPRAVPLKQQNSRSNSSVQCHRKPKSPFL